MEAPHIPHNEYLEAGTEDFTGHWQPALRPDYLNASPERATTYASEAETAPTLTQSNDVPNRREPDASILHPIAVSDHSMLSASSATIEPSSLQNRTLRLSNEQQDVDAASGGVEEERGTRLDNSQDALRSPLVGLSWSSGRRGFGDGEEMSSDEDTERLDPAWGIKRTDTAQFLQSANRSSSFPAFVPQDVPDQAPPNHLITSEVEQIMQYEDDDNEDEDKDKHETAQIDEAETQVGVGAVEDPQTDQLPEAEPEPETSQVRFDEGIPLIPTESEKELQSQESVNEAQPLGNLFNSSEIISEDEASFFDNFGTVGPEEPARPAPLDRKATSDVFESLHFSPDGPPDSPVRAETINQMPNEHSSAFDLTHLTPVEGQEADEDAMWKAALADDEFLVEDADDLLPESPPDSPSSFLGSLRDGGAVQPQQPVHQYEHISGSAASPQRNSRPDFARQSSTNPYAPHQPSTSDLTQLSPTTHNNVGFARLGLVPMNSFQQHLQQRPAPPQVTQSFVDQSKGGYKSPYDLPLDIAKSRRRVQVPLPSPAIKGAAPPPPRSSSMSSDKQLQSPFTPTNMNFPSSVRVPSTQAPPPTTTTTITAGTPLASPPQSISNAKSTSAFFEELPITSRPRPSTGQGRYTPQQNASMPPPQLLPRSPPSRQASQAHLQPSPPRTVADPYAQYQLRAPERLDPYANVPLQVPAPPTTAATSARYSPAPVGSQLGAKPNRSPRYSPVPPPQGVHTATANHYASQPVQPSEPPAGAMPPPNRYASQPTPNPQAPNALPFQPRTSSPLAYHGRLTNEPSRPAPQQSASTSYFLDSTSSLRSQTQAMPMTSAPRPSISTSSPPRPAVMPPKRSQTQSPGKRGPLAAFQMTSDDAPHRPASVHTQTPQVNTYPQIDALPPRPNVRPRGLTQTFEFMAPNDGQQLDELQRWKGAPVFRFGFGGSIISSFPKHVPRYVSGQSAPMIRPSAGEVVTRNAKDVLPLSDLATNFPGPLRSKSKKKDVLSWLTVCISLLEKGEPTRHSFQRLPDSQKRYDEKILLWKILRALVEHDGVLETGADARKSVNSILSPEIFALDEAEATQYRQDSDLSGIYRPAGSSARSDPVDPVAVENLRRSLLRGEREKAVWGAVDNRLWSHALLISSTLDRKVWKQVVQEFVRQEVKVIGANTESLAAVYEIFAGNLEESIDELVPPSARAGLQMVSKVDTAGPIKNALDGLDRWRETLGLVLNNRVPEDAQALAALGRLLASYGRIEAAHICFIFSRGSSQPNLFGGADDPQANIVLLGADHQGQPQTFFHDDDAILLTEVYEFATSILAPAAMSSALPHFQIYKLQRAISLAETGQKAEAQAYCDGLASSLKSNTKMSPYFNPMFFAELDELSSRLKQAPVQSSSSWMAKPSVEKVTSSFFNKFSSFVAGDDSDAESKGSGKDANNEFGPFAKVTGTPSLSRSGSQTDLYGSYPSSTAPIPNTIAASRYAPNGISTARSSSELTRGRPSLDSQRSPPSGITTQGQRSGSFEPPSSFGQHGYAPQATNSYQSLSQSPPATRYQATPPQTSYMPNSMLQESPRHNFSARQPDSYIPTPPPEQAQSSYVPTPPLAAEAIPPPAEHPSFGGYIPTMPSEGASYGEPHTSYNPSYDQSAQSYGYEPPADTGYVPYEPEPDSDTEAETRFKAPKKKSIMDDDADDFLRKSNGISNSPSPPSSTNQAMPDNDADARKRANDAAAEAAFRAAAEADAAREKEKDKDKKGKSGWGLGGWFAGKKSDSLDNPSSSSGGKGSEAKVHRAHLGESKMTLVFDKELKKWVDPSNPESLKQKTVTPPPPRMGGAGKGLPPSASMPVFPASGAGSATGSAGPSSGPPSRIGTPSEGPVSAMAPMMQRPGSSGMSAMSGLTTGSGTPPPGLGPALFAPPSRPSTGMSNASSIDDLLGPVSGNASGRRTVKGKKGAKRYVDVMAQ